MFSFVQNFINPFLIYGIPVFTWGLFAIMTVFYFFEIKRWRPKTVFKYSARAAILFHVFYASVATFGQFHLWRELPLSKNLLPPHNSFAYFWGYSWTHFWFKVVLVIAVATAFYYFLRFLKSRRSRLFDEGEVELGFASALAVGWPGVVIFLGLAFLSAVVLAAIRGLMGKKYTPLGYSFLLAVALTLIFGNSLLELLELKPLVIGGF